jgi:RHS repeat-associated protein
MARSEEVENKSVPISELRDGASAASYLRSLSIDEAFVRNGASTEYYHQDALGSTLTLTDQSGATQTRYQYEPFGRTTSTGASDNAVQYTGRENDGTGLYYYRARYYSSTIGRFLSEDPAGFVVLKRNAGRAPSVTTNLFEYVSNNPSNLIDPFGLWDLRVNGGFHVPLWPPFASVGTTVGSKLQGSSLGTYGDLEAVESGTEIVWGSFADIGFSGGIGDISGTGGKCAGIAIGLHNIFGGKYGGISVTLRRDAKLLQPLTWIDGFEVGLGLGLSLPVTVTTPFPGEYKEADK